MLGVSEVVRMLRGPGVLSAVAGVVLVVGPTLAANTAAAFDYPSYQVADLDVLARRKPQLGLGADIASVQSVRLDVTLIAQADECPTRYLKWAMKKSGIAKDAIASTKITRCIEVKSAKGRQYPLFIQDTLADGLAKDVKPGGTLTVYGSLVYFAARGPGIVVNEYATELTTPPQSHSGVDLTATSKRK